MSGSKTTTSNKIDPALMKLYQQNYGSALGVANRPFQPYTGEVVAPFNSTQTQAQGILSGIGTSNIGDSALNSAVSGTQGILGRTGANTPTLAGKDLSPYMNPYTHDVIDASLARLRQERGMQRVSDNQSATDAGAFGGDRMGVADALTNGQYDLNDANTIASLNAANYDQAQRAGEYDLNHGILGDQTGLAAAGQMANLSQDQLALAANKAGILGAVGDTQQMQKQAEDQSAYEQFMRQWNYAFQQQDVRNAALGLIPLQQTTTQKTSSNPLGGILSGILAGAKAIPIPGG